jgi:superfamily II DNA or RNA helicase
MSKIETTLFYTDDFGNRHGPFVKYEEPKINARDIQKGYAAAMYYNGSLSVPTGVGRTIIECELARNFKRPLYVSAFPEMIKQFQTTADDMCVTVSTCHISKFIEKVMEINPDCVIACETILRNARYTDLVINCGVRVWMNRSGA